MCANILLSEYKSTTDCYGEVNAPSFETMERRIKRDINRISWGKLKTTVKAPTLNTYGNHHHPQSRQTAHLVRQPRRPQP